MKELFKNKIAFISFIYLFFILVLVFFPMLGINYHIHSYDLQNENNILSPPSFQHFLGTDQLGRDLFSRILYGGRLSILVAVITALISFILGVTFGSLAALFQGKIDFIIVRIIDVIYSLPDLLVISLIGLIFHRSTVGILIAIGAISWMDVARLTRAEILKIKNKEFILAAQSIGLNKGRIFYKHIFPNIINIVLVAITFTMPRAIIAESTLSFLGLGLSPPKCSWGTLASDGWQFLNTHLNLILFPSIMIMLTVISLNILGDFLCDLNQSKKSFI